MRRLSIEEARAYLVEHGMRSPSDIEKVLGGFDTMRPLYVTALHEGQGLLQYVRNPSLSNMAPGRGAWFCLAGATLAGLAINGGIAGREQRSFRLRLPATALEGTAGLMPDDLGNAVGGPGGQTQLYVPPCFLGRVQPAEAAE